MFEIKKYTPKYANDWNKFVERSKNGTFLFNREYMDYHSDRFTDCSLLVFRKGKLCTLFPANIDSKIVYSHQGLTYGGLIMSSKVTTSEIVEIFREISLFLSNIGVTKVVYKTIPFIYHQIPAQEDLYGLFKNKATLIGRNISSAIYQSHKIKFIESRKSGMRKALNHHVVIRESEDYASFWDILNTNLANKYGVPPVHTLSEIELLHSRFPNNIKLYLAYIDTVAVAGTVLYITQQVLHTQYISASALGKETGALDLLFDQLINETYKDIPIFDFGQSTEQMGNILNESLIFQKEGFGGRGVVYDSYEYAIPSACHLKLEVYNSEYLEDSYSWLMDAEISEMTDTPPFTREEQKKWYESLSDKNDYLIWGVSFDNSRIGVCGLKKITEDSAEYWGYIGNKDYWGKGLGKEMVSACIDEAKRLRLKTLYLRVLHSNKRAYSLYIKKGFIIDKEDERFIYMNIKL